MAAYVQYNIFTGDILTVSFQHLKMSSAWMVVLAKIASTF